MTGDVKDFEAALAASNARVIAFGASTAVLGGVIRSFKELASVTIDVEKNLADINRVFGLTTSQLQKFSTDLFNVSKQTASTFDDASKAALEFSRQGLKAEDTLQRTKDALTLTRLAGISTANAVDALTSTVNGFAATGVTTTQILNKLVAVEQDYAVGAGDLAEALSRTGQAAQEAGVSLDQLNALVTAAQQSTARGGAVIGNALKTIFTRLQRTETLDQLEAFNISVRDVQGNILPAVQILQNFAGAYRGLADAQRAQLSEQVAGVYQVNILKAIVNDLNKSQGTYAGALQRGASATNEAEIATAKLNQTLDALLKQTATSTQQLANNIGKVTFEPLAKYGTEQLKSFVESMNEVLEGEGIGSTFANGLLKGIRNVIAGPGAIAAFFTLFKLIQNSFTYLSQALPQIAGITTETQNRKNIEQSILQIMQQQGPAAQALAGLMGNQAAQAQLLLQIARQQTAEYQMQTTLAKQLAVQLAGQGVKVKGSGGLQVTRAGGYIPNATKMAEVVGAQAGGYTPGRVVSSPVGGVMNTAEDIKYIPGFAQPFINPPAGSKAGRAHRQNAISRTGVDPYMYSGFIPNFADRVVASIKQIKDGDTISALPINPASVDYRLAGVDAAESNQRFGAEATSLLGQKYTNAEILNKHISSKAKAAYYRNLFDDKDFAQQLVIEGLGVPDLRYTKDSDLLNIADGYYKSFISGNIKSNPGIWGDVRHPKFDQYLHQRGVLRDTNLKDFYKQTSQEGTSVIKDKYKNLLKSLRFEGAYDEYIRYAGYIPNFATPMSTASIPWFKKYSSKYKNASGDTDLFKMGDFPTYGRGLDHEYAKKGNSAMLSYLHEDFVRSALNIALGSKKVIRPAEVGFKNKPVSDIANENDFDLLYRIADGSYSMLELKQDFKNVSGSVTGFMNKKLVNLEKENPVLAKKVSSMIAVSNRPKFTDPTGRNAGANFSEFEMAAASIVKDKYSNVDPSISAKLTKVTDGLLRRYEAKKNTTYGGFIPNFAYKQAVMGLEESMSGNKAIFDTKPFPHIRNSSQPTFSSAIADHGGLGNALSDSMRGQKAAGLMNKGFIPNFGNLKSTKNKIAKNKAGNQSQNTQSGFDPNQLQAETERIAQDVVKKIKYAYDYVSVFAASFADVVEQGSQKAKTAINSGISKVQASANNFNQTVSNQTQGGSGGGTSRLTALSQRLQAAGTAISIGGPLLAGFVEQAYFGNKKRTEMTSTERSLQSGLSTGLSSVSTGAGIGGAVAGIPGAVVGGLIGSLIGLTSAVQASSLSVEELTQLTDEQKSKTQENLSAGQKYIQAQEEYAKLLASGASSTQLENASRNLTNSFNEIKDVKLAEELSKTKGGVEALNSVLGNFEQEQKKLTSGLEFATLIKGGKIESGLQKTVAGKALANLGLNQEQLKQLQSYKKATERVKIPRSAGVGGVFMQEIDVVSQASVDQAKSIAKQIAEKQLGGKATAAEIETVQESLTKALLEGTLPDIINTISTSDNATKQAVQQAKALASLYSTRNKLEAQIIKDISSGNQLIKQSEFSQKLLDALNDFQVSMMEGVANPLEIAARKAQSQTSKFARETEDEQRKVNIDFVKQNYKTLLESSQNPTYIEQSIKPAIAEMLKGNFAPFERLLSGSQSVGAFAESSALGGPSALQPKESQQLKEAYAIYKATEAERKSNNGDQKKLIDQDILLQNLKSTTLLLQSNIIKDEISLTAQRERLEIQRKNTLDLEIDAIERRQSDEANYFGMSVAGKAQGKADFRNQILQKKLIDTEITRSKSTQADYSEVIKMQNENALKDADRLQSQGNVILADSLRSKARRNTGVEIKDLTSLNQAITSLESTKFADPKQEEQRVKTLEKLKTVQTEINEGKITQIELNDRLNKQELIMAERSTSFKYGVVKGFDDLRTESELMIGRLGEDLPKMFADGLVNGIKAAIRESDNLGSALMGIASSFLDTVSTTLMQSAVYGILGNLGVANLPVATKQRGGVIRAQSGMYISGVGSGDKYPALLENGEYVLNRNAVMAMGGPASLDKLNFSAAPRFAAGGTFSSNFEDISSMESNMTSFGLEESKLYNELRDQKRAEIEAARQKKRAQKQQMAGIIGSLAGAAVSLGISAGVNKFGNKPSTPQKIGDEYGQLALRTDFSGSPFRKQSGGLIGSRLSDTIPAYATGGLVDNPIVKRYAIGGASSGVGYGGAIGNSSTINNNTNASNSFNFNTTVQRDGKIEIGANSTSYAQQDVELSQNLNSKVYDVVLDTIRKEKRFGGSLAGIRN
jgi:TP901 family phage tail tape measure protein